jgi:thioredoxin 1
MLITIKIFEKKENKMNGQQEVRNIDDVEFNEITGEGVTLVDFWAPWCAPCRIQGPILEKVVKKIGDKANICKLNVDENRESAGKFGITGIPTLLIFKNGEVVKQFVGVQDEDTLVSSLESSL